MGVDRADMRTEGGAAPPLSTPYGGTCSPAGSSAASQDSDQNLLRYPEIRPLTLFLCFSLDLSKMFLLDYVYHFKELFLRLSNLPEETIRVT